MIATKAEIDAWVSASPFREAFSLTRYDAESTKTIKQLREHLEEMHRLRVEATQWRNEMVAARDSLHRSIGELHESLRSVFGEDSEEKRRTADVLALDPKRKVN